MRKKILIIEDEPIIALDFEQLIYELGIDSVIKCFNGNKALAEIKYNRPDLVLLDINLNDDVSGFELAEVLYKEKISFIIITGSSDINSLKKINQMNADLVLLKPVSQFDFKNAVNSILQEVPSNPKVLS